MKRAIDVVIALMLLCLTAPLMLMASVYIICANDGPILFRQVRVGRFGCNFEILKFRTMSIAGQSDGITVGNDSRITRAGHVLRRSKIDELPQLFNVLKGDMSLVGPRPEIPEYYALYPVADREIISSILPGITDRASIIYRNEAELLAEHPDPDRYSREVILPHKISIGIEYLNTKSIRGDFKILLDTIGAVLAGGEARHKAAK
jgi:lipopolysaccharide/colanic/teichoic acid biosynthesis glycosyltransferase